MRSSTALRGRGLATIPLTSCGVTDSIHSGALAFLLDLGAGVTRHADDEGLEGRGGSGTYLSDLSRRLQPVENGHIEVHEDNFVVRGAGSYPLVYGLNRLFPRHDLGRVQELGTVWAERPANLTWPWRAWPEMHSSSTISTLASGSASAGRETAGPLRVPRERGGS